MRADVAQLGDDAPHDLRHRPEQRPRDENQNDEYNRNRNGQAKDRDRERWVPQPANAVERGRDVEVSLEDAADNQTDDQRGSRPAEPLHDPADHPEDHQGVEIAPVMGALVAGHEDERQHDRQQDFRPYRGDAGEPLAAGQADQRADHMGERQAPHDRIGHVELLRQHVGAGREPVHQEGAQQDGHRGAGRNAERDGRHQVAALLGVVGAFRRDHAAHVAGAEGFRILLGALGIAIGDPVDHRRADARDGAEPGAENAATNHEPPVAADIAHAFPLICEIDVGGVLAGNLLARDCKLAKLGQCEEAEHGRHQGHAVIEVERVEGPAQRPALRARPDHRDHQAKAGGGPGP